ncbi:50S ribosomal protein L20 [Candidatus Roizmanbacteria bacterium RIFCSPHIGHO2_01_FULL_39_12b]|uniref:Large ribosomal subunit protein bL20 n=1 Tax=Candidatus Roizmanbacteria bacterium RIFCSPHIGHO2_01_FULL_39_12b TaxID=1802030 RepID=A0A1F7GE70_9BACT|nr:MAG: 50S ribosomal protein L20 [Candidatus Roizmanbacteria bacterium RIFCSPHIGHO2_01_FULL_39_12b]
MRVKGGKVTRRRHNKLLKLARGYRMSRSTLINSAHEAVLHAGEYAFHGRKLRKRNFRTLWIVRINAELKKLGITYRDFIHMLRINNIAIDRKILAVFATRYPAVFAKIVETAQK